MLIYICEKKIVWNDLTYNLQYYFFCTSTWAMPTHTRTCGIRASNWAAPTNPQRPDPTTMNWTRPGTTKPDLLPNPHAHRLACPNTWTRIGPKADPRSGYLQSASPGARTWDQWIPSTGLKPLPLGWNSSDYNLQYLFMHCLTKKS